MAEYNGRDRTNCASCARPFRSRTQTVKDKPGSALYGANGLCKNCHRRVRKEQRAYNTPMPTAEQLEGKAREDKKNLDSFLSRIRAQGQKNQRQARQRMVIR